jgi:lipid-A-disaccharide synthase
LSDFKPDVVILVDYPGFNLRIARYAHENGIRVFYYISPQLWAWKSSRVKIIRKNVDRMFVILPFEKAFYSRYNYAVDFVGHPLSDVINDQQKLMNSDAFRKNHDLGEKPLIALLPGSRKQEIRKVLNIMLQVAEDFKDYQFVVAGAPSVSKDLYKSIIGERSVKIITGQTYDLLNNSEAALVTSGTATLETALLGVPQVVCYKGSPVSYFVARLVIHVKFISLVNLIMDHPLLAELIQTDLTREKLKPELEALLGDTEKRRQMLQAYVSLREKLGGRGTSERTAGLMIRYVKESSQTNHLTNN